MIIDVIDLDFKGLTLNRNYDITRYRKAEMIYNQGRVNILQVDKLDDNNYSVKANVLGQHGRYVTNLHITGTKIIETSCTCEDSAKGNLCKHVLATIKEVIDPHDASTKEGKRRLEEKRREEIKRRQEEYRLMREREQKQREYNQKYSSSLNILERFKMNDNKKEMSTSLNLPELYKEVSEEKTSRSGELATEIKLEACIEYVNRENIKVAFKIGQTRMYALGDIVEFYNAYRSGTELYYGKQLTLIPKRENFDNQSKPIFDYVIKYGEMMAYSNKYTGSNRYYQAKQKELYVNGDDIEELFEIIGASAMVKSYGIGILSYSFTDEKMELKCTLKKERVTTNISRYYYSDEIVESDEYVLRLNIHGYLQLNTPKHIYIFYNQKIYTLDKDQATTELLDLFYLSDKVLVPEDRFEEFDKYVLSKLRKLEVENLPEKLVLTGRIVDDLATKMLLDVSDAGNILLELKFCYGDIEFNILDKKSKTYAESANIVRDVPKETDIVKKLFMDGFELIENNRFFVLKNDDAIYEFLTQKIESYMNDFEVLATDRFKNKEIKRPKLSSVGIRVDNGLLELDISKINIDINEIKDILKDYSVKKKYHKLKNGDIYDLRDNNDLELLEEITNTLDIDYSKLKNGVINLPINRSMYLENIIGSNKNLTVSKNENYVEIIDNIDNANNTEDLENDEILDKLRDYQKIGYKWLKTLEKYKFGGILADDMGLGKTLQIIAVLKASMVKAPDATSIVVCPSTLVLNWKAEIEKWCPDIKVLIVRGNAEERRAILDTYDKYNLVITSYDLLKRDVESYEDKKFNYIIADEAQYIKNSTTQNATAIKSLKGEVRYALTGTPIENSIAELWSIFDFVMPGYLYNYNKFKKKFEEPILKLEDKASLNQLKKLISPFVLRRVKQDVLTELPEKNITIMKNEMETEQEKIYLSYLAQTKKEIADELGQNSFEKSKFKILMLLTRLRQICCHPSLFIENYKGTSGKLKQCMDLVNDAIASEHKILLFSSYTSMFDIIEKEFNKANIRYFRLSGDTPVSKRISMVEEFNKDKDVKVFLISLKAGGTGLNLTSADVVIHYDPWWNISSENQATDRAYRIGQKNSVQVYKLITSNSIEEKINKMQERKEKLSKDVLSTEETFINKLTREEVLDLFN